MEIAGYLRTSLIEWPGKISSVIFVPGCNFRCPFCHNSNLVDPQKIKKLPLISEPEVLADLKKRKKWIDGVVITGGEPTLQEDLPKFLERIKKLGFATMIETNGSLPQIVQSLIGHKLLDYLTMDFKLPFEDYGKMIKGRKSKDKSQDCKFKVKISLKLILKNKVPFELRTTIVPGIHDEKILVKMAKQLRTLLSDCPAIKLPSWTWQNFQPKNCLNLEFRKIKPYNRRELNEFLKAVKVLIPGVKVRD